MTQEAKKLHKLRLRHAKFISTLLICQPFVRAVVLNGSLAKGTSTASSDIDLLIIVKSGRIFTSRFFSTFAVWLTGLKRGSGESSVSRGRFCLNYYLTDGFLIVPHHRGEEMNRYCAESYSASILLAGDRALFDKFLAMNTQWMSCYLSGKSEMRNSKSETIFNIQNSRRISNTQYDIFEIKQLLESILSSKVGQRVENYLKRMQLKRIYSDPRTQTYPDLIHADDREMRFHPPKNC